MRVCVVGNCNLQMRAAECRDENDINWYMIWYKIFVRINSLLRKWKPPVSQINISFVRFKRSSSHFDRWVVNFTNQEFSQRGRWTVGPKKSIDLWNQRFSKCFISCFSYHVLLYFSVPLQKVSEKVTMATANNDVWIFTGQTRQAILDHQKYCIQAI